MVAAVGVGVAGMGCEDEEGGEEDVGDVHGCGCTRIVLRDMLGLKVCSIELRIE